MKTVFYILIQATWGILPYFANQRKQGRSYFSFFTERWANCLGERVTGQLSMEQFIID